MPSNDLVIATLEHPNYKTAVAILLAMITDWTVKNFKSIYDKTTISLSPLTIFAGANSSGKSTVLQSILLIAQTLQNSVQSRSVVLNGHIVRLGTYNDIASNSCEAMDISIGFTLQPTPESARILSANQALGIYPYYATEIESRAEKINCSISFGSDGEEQEREALQLQPRLKATSVKISYKDNPSPQDGEVQIVASKQSVQHKTKEFSLRDETLSSTDLASLTYDVVRPVGYKSRRRNYIMNAPTTGRPAGAAHAHFLPARISIVYNTIEENANILIEAMINIRQGLYIDESIRLLWKENMNPIICERIINLIQGFTDHLASGNKYSQRRLTEAFGRLKEQFSFENYQAFTSYLSGESRQLYASLLIDKTEMIKSWLTSGKKSDFRMTFVPLSAPADYATTYIRGYFGNQLKYLGPLRDEPKPIYPLSGTTDPRDVGFRGEHTAAVLDIHKQTLIRYISSNDLNSSTSNPQVSNVSLLHAVADWLDYLGVVTSVKTADKGKLGHELRVSTGSTDNLHDLTHVGVGVSQVLPILVMALLAEQDSALVFEQPELHLHPRVQTRLADFFVSMNLLKKQCIVETHSEYLINRLRYLSALSNGTRASADTIIYFVEKVEGHSQYRPIKINQQGVIEDWPKGFFDENEENSAALLRLAMEKRKNLRAGRE